MLRQAQWMAGIRRGGEIGAAPSVVPVPLEATEPEAAVTKGRGGLTFLEAELATPEALSAGEDEPISEPARAEAAPTMDMQATAPSREPERPPGTAEAESPSSPPSSAVEPEASPGQRITASEVRRRADEPGVEIADNAAAPTPVQPGSPIPSTTPSPTGDEVTFRFGDRRWRVRGLPRSTCPARG